MTDMISTRPIVALLLSFLLAATCIPASAEEPTLPPYIGSAEMKADGSIVLNLRAEGPGGIVGHSLLTYPPDHPQYREILDHLGPIEPGDSVAVKPWPDPPR